MTKKEYIRFPFVALANRRPGALVTRDLRASVAAVLFASIAATAAPISDHQQTEDTAQNAPGYREIMAGDMAAAEARLDAADPEDPKVLLNLAAVHRLKGQYASANELYTQVLNGRQNPYVVTGSGAPHRAKTVAKTGLKQLRTLTGKTKP